MAISDRQATTAQAHQEVLKLATEQIHVAYRRAVNFGVVRPVVFLLDLQEQAARTIAGIAETKGYIAGPDSGARLPGASSVVAHAFAEAFAEDFLEHLSPQCAAQLRNGAPAGKAIVVTVTGAGLSLSATTIPNSKRKPKRARRRLPR